MFSAHGLKMPLTLAQQNIIGINTQNVISYYQILEYSFSGDRLVYYCDNKDDAVYGGIDDQFDQFQCTDEGLYNVPNPTKEQLARGEHGWPLCSPQRNCKNKYTSEWTAKF